VVSRLNIWRLGDFAGDGVCRLRRQRLLYRTTFSHGGSRYMSGRGRVGLEPVSLEVSNCFPICPGGGPNSGHPKTDAEPIAT
jgi:hypothetical protein